MSVYLTASEIVVSLKSIIGFQEKFPKFVLPFGMESEFFAFIRENGQMKPVNLSSEESQEFFARAFSNAEVFKIIWDLGTDLGQNMEEVAFKKFFTSLEYVEAMITFFDFMAKDPLASTWSFVFGDNPNTELGYVSKPRYKGIIKAVGEYAQKVIGQMIEFGALQINCGVESIGGLFSPKTASLMEALNNLGPVLAVLTYSIDPTRKFNRLPRVFTEFTDIQRLPHYFGKGDLNDLRDQLLKIPYLIKEVQKDIWEPADSSDFPQSVNEVDSSTIWWGCRASGISAGLDKQRFEFRDFDIFNPVQSVYVVNWFNYILIELIARIDRKEFIPYLTEKQWNDIRYKNNQVLAKRFLNEMGLMTLKEWQIANCI